MLRSKTRLSSAKPIRDELSNRLMVEASFISTYKRKLIPTTLGTKDPPFHNFVPNLKYPTSNMSISREQVARKIFEDSHHILYEIKAWNHTFTLMLVMDSNATRVSKKLRLGPGYASVCMRERAERAPAMATQSMHENAKRETIMWAALLLRCVSIGSLFGYRTWQRWCQAGTLSPLLFQEVS